MIAKRASRGDNTGPAELIRSFRLPIATGKGASTPGVCSSFADAEKRHRSGLSVRPVLRARNDETLTPRFMAAHCMASLGGAPHAYAPISDFLVAKGSIWKYIDDGSDQGTARQPPTPIFNDTLWAQGPAQLSSAMATETKRRRDDGRFWRQLKQSIRDDLFSA
ncbi:MAG: hypothetical protein ACI841_002657 [Planctomycetota bacterium]|jgi:hypothetical protein